MRNFLEPAVDLNGRAILVTGGTGSFGKAFVDIVLKRYRPARLVIYSRDEQKQFEMEQALRKSENAGCLRFFIGDVRDKARLEMALAGIEYVVHAAALKHVPIAEYNPFECIHTNVIGAENVVRASIRAGVRRVIALSTDKAANPINLYGASKLASDKIFCAAFHLAGAQGPRFAVVRYGNVIGSRGSVIPLFQQLVAEKADYLPITDPEMTRFWITLEQGINFVLSSFALMRGAEVFIPRLPSMRIADLVATLAPQMPTKVIGMRPGEKLHEILLTADDARLALAMDDRYVVVPNFTDWHRHEYIELGALPVPARFAYASNTNEEQLGSTELWELLTAAKLDRAFRT